MMGWTMDLELDAELFPARRSLIGLQFADEQDFARARQLIGYDLAFYHEVYPYWLMIVVRRTDTQRFADAGLHFAEIEQIDEEDLPPEEVAALYRNLIESWKPVLRERLRRTQ